MKYPKLESKDEMKKDGVAYAYLDSTAKNFRLSNHKITDDDSAIGSTLQTFYNSSEKNVAHLMYNDCKSIFEL